MKVMVIISRDVEVPDKFALLAESTDENTFDLHREFCEYISKALNMPFSSDVERGYMGDSIDGVYEKEEWTPLIEC